MARLDVHLLHPAHFYSITAVAMIQLLTALILAYLELCGRVGRLGAKRTLPFGLTIAFFAVVLDALTMDLLSKPDERTDTPTKSVIPFLVAITGWWAALFIFMMTTMGKKERKVFFLIFCILFGGYYNLSHGLSFGYQPQQKRFRGADELMLVQAAIFCYCSFMDDGEELYSYTMRRELKKQKVG
jgi:hypothetical protein